MPSERVINVTADEAINPFYTTPINLTTPDGVVSWTISLTEVQFNTAVDYAQTQIVTLQKPDIDKYNAFINLTFDALTAPGVIQQLVANQSYGKFIKAISEDMNQFNIGLENKYLGAIQSNFAQIQLSVS
jgi:hypothetical protein